MEEMVVLSSEDSYCFRVEKEVAMKLPNYKKWVETNGSKLFVLKLNNKRMGRWLDYCKNLVSPSISYVPDRVFVNQFEHMFVNQLDGLGLYFLIQDAHTHNFRSLLDLACGALVDKVDGKSDEEIRKAFFINEVQESFDNSVAKLVYRIHLIVNAPVASEDQHDLSQGLMRDPEEIKDENFHVLKLIPDPKTRVPEFQACIDNFMLCSDFMFSSDHDYMRELLDATKQLEQSIDGDGRPFLNKGLNVDVSERLFQILQAEMTTFLMEKIQCVAASILSRTLIYSGMKKVSYIYKNAFAVVIKNIPVMVKLMWSNSILLLAQVLKTLTFFIADYPSCAKDILESGALEAAERIVQHKHDDEVLCNLAKFLGLVCSHVKLNSDQEGRFLNIIKDIYHIYRFLPYSSCKVTATHALAYLSFKNCVDFGEAILQWLVEFISPPSFTDGDTRLPDSAVGVVGNIIRWGSSEQIKYLKNDCKLLQSLCCLPCHKGKKFRVEACRIILNMAARNAILINDLGVFGLKEAVITLANANDCDVKLEAAYAVYNCVYGCELKRLTTVFKDGSSDY